VKLPLKKYLGLIIAGLALITIVAAALIIGPAETKKKTEVSKSTGPCGPYRHDAQIGISGQIFDVELPKNPDAFAKGLGGRPCITASEGMLFSFKQPGRYPFWMKGMKFPIDIIWIGADHKVAAVEVDEKPSSYPDKFVNQKPAQYVLEIKANLSKELNINIGTPVTL
jgi:uncharacterized membrane protein (UPF0127 family)